jgi:PAS domain S-box-containing protein
MPYRYFFDPIIFFTTDEKMNIISVNKFTLNLLKRTKEELIHQNISAILSESSLEKLNQIKKKQNLHDVHIGTVLLEFSNSNNEIFPIDCSILKKIETESNTFKYHIIGLSNKFNSNDESYGGSNSVIDYLFTNKPNEKTLRYLQNQQFKINDLLNFNETIDKLTIVIITDLNGIILSVNNYFLRVSGYSLEEIIGQNINILQSGYHPQNFFIYLWDEIQRKKIWEGEIQNKTKNGKLFWVDCIISPIQTDEGESIGYLSVQVDITDKKKLSTELEKEQSKFKDLINSITDMFFGFDFDLKYNYWNKASEIQTGIKEEDAIGKHLFDLFPKTEETLNAERIYKSVLENQISASHITRYNIANQDLYLELNVYPSNSGLSVFVKDITNQKIVENKIIENKDILEKEVEIRTAELKKAKDQAEKANKIKNDFLAIMSHEIRTPIHAISGFISFLDNEQIDFNKKVYFDSIKSSIDGLLGLVNNLLELSNKNEDTFLISEVEFKTNDFIRELTLEYDKKFLEKGIQFHLHYNSIFPQILFGDKRKFQNLLQIILSNALKFTDVGSVNLSLNFSKMNTNYLMIHILLEDTGIGIFEENLPKIFEPFFMESNTINRKYKGGGLGLSIAKKIINLLNGEIQINSIKDKGTTVKIELPFRYKDIQIDDRNKNTEYIRSNINVLIVEDEEYNRIIITKFLKIIFNNLDIAENGVVALQLMRAKNYDLILTDLHMPEMNGFELSENIRKNYLIPQPIIIAVTADAYQSTKSKCLELGMNDFLAKPFKKNELYEVIAKYVKISNKI